MKYKTQYSENYYRTMWDQLAAKYTKNDPEKDLQILMNGLDNIPEEARDVITSIQAQRVYKFLKEALQGTMKTIIRIQTGQASLGYTTMAQEIAAKRELIEGFEFDCLRLADFRKKYIDA